MKLHRRLCLLLVVICLTIIAGCGDKTDHRTARKEDSTVSASDNTTEKREIFAMDTIMTISATGINAKEAVDEAVEEIQRLDALLSVGNDESEVSRLNQNGSGKLSEDVLYLAQRSLKLYDMTQGAFDITVYPLMELWGFTGDNPALPEAERIKEVLKLSGSDKLRLEGNDLTLGKNQGIDFGGIAKGYAGDRIMKIFEKRGIQSGVISLGGNVQCYHTKEDGSQWRCGVTDPEHPEDSSNLMGILSVADKAVITSGGYERFFQDNSGRIYHHIMDLKTGYPAESGLTSVTIVSSDGTLADGLSTSCFVLGEEKATQLWRDHQQEFDMVLMTTDGRLMVTEGIADSFSSNRAFSIISFEDD